MTICADIIHAGGHECASRQLNPSQVYYPITRIVIGAMLALTGQPGGGLIQRIVNAILNALASVADAFANIADDRAEARSQDAQQAALAALVAEAEANNQQAIAANYAAQAATAQAEAAALQAQIAAAQGSMQALEQQIAELIANPPVGGALVFTYDASGRLIGEYTTDGTPVRRYLWLEDLPLALIDEDGIQFIHSDHLHTPQAVTDSNGTVVWTADYAPFGEVTETISNIEMNLRFPGQYHDRETGLHQNWHREYAPHLGRYTQSDPIGLRGGLNVYEYAQSSPLLFSDRLGLFPTCESVQIRLNRRTSERHDDIELWRGRLPVPVPREGTASQNLSLTTPARIPVRPGVHVDVLLVEYLFAHRTTYQVHQAIQVWKSFCVEKIVDECGQVRVYRSIVDYEVPLDPIERRIGSEFIWTNQVLRTLGSFTW